MNAIESVFTRQVPAGCSLGRAGAGAVGAAAAWSRAADRRSTGVQVVRRHDGQPGFAILGRRWIIVERTSAWINQQETLRLRVLRPSHSLVEFLRGHGLDDAI
jgi:hypothetical protein